MTKISLQEMVLFLFSIHQFHCLGFYSGWQLLFSCDVCFGLSCCMFTAIVQGFGVCFFFIFNFSRTQLPRSCWCHSHVWLFKILLPVPARKMQSSNILSVLCTFEWIMVLFLVSIHMKAISTITWEHKKEKEVTKQILYCSSIVF